MWEFWWLANSNIWVGREFWDFLRNISDSIFFVRIRMYYVNPITTIKTVNSERSFNKLGKGIFDIKNKAFEDKYQKFLE